MNAILNLWVPLAKELSGLNICSNEQKSIEIVGSEVVTYMEACRYENVMA